MSKENVLQFFSEAAKDEQLKTQLKETSNQEELVGVANKAGYDFSSEHVDEALTEMKKKQGFFGVLAQAALEVFSPSHDDYPATGMQPFSGDPKR